MKYKQGPITDLWNEAKSLIEQKNLTQAEDILDKGIVLLAQAKLDGCGDKDLLEGVKREVWLERFWIKIEQVIWPTRPNYETFWKCQ